MFGRFKKPVELPPENQVFERKRVQFDDKRRPLARFKIPKYTNTVGDTEVLIELTEIVVANLYRGKYVGIIWSKVNSTAREQWVRETLPDFYDSKYITFCDPKEDVDRYLSGTIDNEQEQRSIKLS